MSPSELAKHQRHSPPLPRVITLGFFFSTFLGLTDKALLGKSTVLKQGENVIIFTQFSTPQGSNTRLAKGDRLVIDRKTGRMWFERPMGDQENGIFQPLGIRTTDGTLQFLELGALARLDITEICALLSALTGMSLTLVEKTAELCYCTFGRPRHLTTVKP